MSRKCEKLRKKTIVPPPFKLNGCSLNRGWVNVDEPITLWFHLELICTLQKTSTLGLYCYGYVYEYKSLSVIYVYLSTL